MARYQTIVGHGEAEEQILQEILEHKRLPSKTEAWKRGLHAYHLLAGSDPYPLLALTADLLRALAAYSHDREKLAAATAYALPIAQAAHAMLVAQHGPAESEFFEVFPGTLHTLNQAFRQRRPDVLKEERIAEELRGLATFLEVHLRSMPQPAIGFKDLFPAVVTTSH